MLFSWMASSFTKMKNKGICKKNKKKTTPGRRLPVYYKGTTITRKEMSPLMMSMGFVSKKTNLLITYDILCCFVGLVPVTYYRYHKNNNIW